MKFVQRVGAINSDVGNVGRPAVVRSNEIVDEVVGRTNSGLVKFFLLIWRRSGFLRLGWNYLRRLGLRLGLKIAVVLSAPVSLKVKAELHSGGHGGRHHELEYI